MWIVVVAQVFAGGTYVMLASSHQTEDACLAEAEMVRIRMAQIRMVVEVKCEMTTAAPKA